MRAVEKGTTEDMIKILIMVFIIIAIFATMWLISEKVIINTVKNMFS